MLTSPARESLRGVETVIVDEVHAVAGTKRGAHLALSLERLDELLERPPSGSACPRPCARSTRWPASSAAAARSRWSRPAPTKEWDLKVVVPVEDMTELALDELGGGEELTDVQEGSAAGGTDRRGSIWPHVEERVVDLIERTARPSSSPTPAGSPSGSPPGSTRSPPSAPRPDAAAARPADRPAQVMAQSGQAGGAAVRSPAPTTARSPRSSARSSRTTSSAAGCPAWSPPPASSSASTWARSTWSCRSSRRRAWPAALQRVGRAGHQVGEVSRGVLLPKHRGDLVHTAVAVERMRAGAIEALRVPANPLDVLAQQIVAMIAVDAWDVDELFGAGPPGGAVRDAAPVGATTRCSTCSPAATRATSSPSCGRGWSGTGSPAPWPAGRAPSGSPSPAAAPSPTAGCSASSWSARRPAGSASSTRRWSTSPGSATCSRSAPPSWRIEDITHDRVLVSPAPGQPGRLPFWKGDQLGRPAELGAAIGAFTRELGRAAATSRRRPAAPRPGSTSWAAGNLLAYLGEQREATRVLPDDRTVVVERFRDELGDWRVVVHSPFGAQVHAPWALAIGGRLRERYGVDAQVLPADDGIVLRLPETDQEPPGADLVVFEPDEIEEIVTTEVGGSALFASRFRECAARALLLPRRDPRPALPAVAAAPARRPAARGGREYPSFPIVLETVRECLQDVYDVPALVGADARARLPQGPGRRGGDHPAVAVRPVAAVRLRRRVPVRGRLPPRRAPGRRALPGPGPARRAARPGRAARAARPRRARRDSSAELQRLTDDRRPATPRASSTCSGCSAR